MTPDEIRCLKRAIRAGAKSLGHGLGVWNKIKDFEVGEVLTAVCVHCHAFAEIHADSDEMTHFAPFYKECPNPEFTGIQEMPK